MIPDNYILAVETGVVLLVFFILMLLRKMPSTESFDHILTSLNSKGGNIAILSFMTLISFVCTNRMFYYMLEQAAQGRINQDNSFALMGLQFMSTSAFGLFAGALINTMTGASVKLPTSPGEPAKPVVNSDPQQPLGAVFEAPKTTEDK